MASSQKILEYKVELNSLHHRKTSYDLRSRNLPITKYVILTASLNATKSAYHANGSYSWALKLVHQFTGKSNQCKSVNFRVRCQHHTSIGTRKANEIYNRNYSIEIQANSSHRQIESIYLNASLTDTLLIIFEEEMTSQMDKPFLSSIMKMDLKRVFEDDSTKDIKFTVGHETVMAHSLIIAARCKALYTTVIDDEGTVETMDTTMPIFKCFLQYLYTDTIDKIEECAEAEQLIPLAVKYNMDCLKNKCQKHLCQRIDKSNIIPLLMNAKSFDCQLLKDDALFKMKLFIEDLYNTQEFQQLSDPDLLQETIVSISTDDFYREDSNVPMVCSEMVEHLRALYNDNSSKDVEFKIGRESVRAHKLIVSARSKVLKTMLGSEMKEKNGVVVIDDTNVEAFKAFLLYLYTEEIENIEKFAEDLLVLADKYDLQCLKDKCEDCLCNKIEKENVVCYLITGKLLNCQKLKISAMSKLPSFIQDIWESQEFRQLKAHPDLQKEVLNHIVESRYVENN